jgi:hypothetical protein
MKVSAKMKGQGRGIDVAREIWAKERTSEIASVREGSYCNKRKRKRRRRR